MALSFNQFKKTLQAFKKEALVVYWLWQDPRTPLLAKILLCLSVAYLFSPIDLIPDFIPILGQLDDLLLVPLLVYVALKFVPLNLAQEVRQKVTHSFYPPIQNAWWFVLFNLSIWALVCTWLLLKFVKL